MKQVLALLFLSAFFLTGCSNMDVDDMLESRLPVMSEERRQDASSENGQEAVSVLFLDYQNMGIALKLRKEGSDEQLDYQQEIEAEDIKDMTDMAHRLIQTVPSPQNHTLTWCSGGKTIRIYRGGVYSGQSTQYKIMVTVEEEQ